MVGVELASDDTRPGRRRRVAAISSTMPVIAYDARIAAVHALLLATVRRQGRPRGAHDLMIAATARATGRIVVTTDASGFPHLPDVAVRSH